MLSHALHNFQLQQQVDLSKAKLLLAVSGGVDSMALLDLCVKAGLNCTVAHVNFGLRGEDSNADEALVKKVCKKHKIPLHLYHPNTKEFADSKELSIQMAARELRYVFFESLIKKNGYEYVITAHHANDNIEHLFIYLLRNNPSTAFKGIPAVRMPYLRPLLQITKKEVLEYAENNKLAWREDASNETINYLRNKIRHMIIPGLEAEFPEVLQEFYQIAQELQNKAARQLVRDGDLLKTTLTHRNGNTTIPKNLFESRNGLRAIALYLRAQGFTPSQIDSIPAAQTGAVFEAPMKDLVVEANALQLLKGRYTMLEYCVELHEKPKSIIQIKAGAFSIRIMPDLTGEILNLPDTWYFDISKVQFPLKFRNRKSGDKMQPWGMVGHKKLSDVFVDSKTGASQKDLYPVVESPSGILGIIGIRRSALARVSTQTKMVLCIRWVPTEDLDKFHSK